jgi:cell division protein FtsI (penicillin-binding protein 3)
MQNLTNLSLPIQPATKAAEDNAIETCKNRLVVILFTIIIIFSALIYRVFEISLSSREDFRIAKNAHSTEFYVQRGAITDRNGTLLAVNLNTASLYANPQKVIDSAITAEKLCTTLALKKCDELKAKLASNKNFIWIKRHLSPREQQLIYNLGLPGLNFINEERRAYTHGNLFAHTVGFVDLDGSGMAGIERYFNHQLASNINDNLHLSLDVRIQQILREEIANQVSEHNALGGSGLIMNANTGEVLAMVSLPDFDPHRVSEASDRQRFNQVTLGNYEMGSTFKILTMAMGLDGKFIQLNDAFNVGAVIKVGNHQISDYKGKGGVLSVPEILMYSSNIGTAQIAMKVGIKNQRNYLGEFGLLKAPEIELPEKSSPLYPSARAWNQSSLITISYGHGMAVTPLHVASTIAAVVNGGKFIKPTMLKVEDPSNITYKEVLSPQTSDLMRKMLRLVVTHGSGKRANIDGYLVGGKTGTAEKVTAKGVYSKTANIASFVGAFPIHHPQYVILTIIDEAKPGPQNAGFTTGGMIAAPVAGRVIERIAPILNVAPVDEFDEQIRGQMRINFTPQRAKLNF